MDMFQSEIMVGSAVRELSNADGDAAASSSSTAAAEATATSGPEEAEAAEAAPSSKKHKKHFFSESEKQLIVAHMDRYEWITAKADSDAHEAFATAHRLDYKQMTTWVSNHRPEHRARLATRQTSNKRLAGASSAVGEPFKSLTVAAAIASAENAENGENASASASPSAPPKKKVRSQPPVPKTLNRVAAAAAEKRTKTDKSTSSAPATEKRTAPSKAAYPAPKASSAAAAAGGGDVEKESCVAMVESFFGGGQEYEKQVASLTAGIASAEVTIVALAASTVTLGAEINRLRKEKLRSEKDAEKAKAAKSDACLALAALKKSRQEALELLRSTKLAVQHLADQLSRPPTAPDPAPAAPVDS